MFSLQVIICILWVIFRSLALFKLNIYWSEVLLFSNNFTIPVDETEAETDEATNKNARGCVFACNLECGIAVVEVVFGMVDVVTRQIILVKPEVPALEDTEKYEAEQKM